MIPLKREDKILQGFYQSIISLLFNLGGMLAGTFLALNLDLLSTAPWAIVLFPCVLSVRGAIGGLFSGRLSTGLHLGTIKTSYTKNTRAFYALFSSVITLTLISCILMSCFTFLAQGLLDGYSAIDYIDILIVTTGTMGLSLIFLSPITVGVSFLSFKRGLNPDVMTYPITSTTADIIVTLCYLSLLQLFFSNGLGRCIVEIIDIVFVVSVLFFVSRDYTSKEFMSTIREFLLTLLIITVIVNITGFILGGIKELIGDRPEIYIIYPALIDTIGDVGSIIGSTATTKLFMGVIQARLSSVKDHLTEIFSAWAASLVMFILYFLIVLLLKETFFNFNAISFLLKILATNLIAISFMILGVYLTAVLTFKRAWNPDNFVIPIESSIADAITTFSLLISLKTLP